MRPRTPGRRIPALMLAVLLSSVATANPILFPGARGDLSAVASFELAGGNLRVILTNTSPHDVMNPSEILTAVFFNLPGNPTLSRISAVVAPGSAVWFGGTDPGGVVGGEWAYRSRLSGAPGGARQGISSSRLGLFGKFARFPGTNRQGPKSPDGLQYGITSAGDDPNTGNQKVTGSDALVHSSVVFTFGNVPGNLRLDAISAVSFQYGTSLSEPNVPDPKNPEPATLLLVAPALLWAAWRYRRKVI